MRVGKHGPSRALAAGARGLGFAVLLASPLLPWFLVPPQIMPRTLVFVWTAGGWLVLLGALVGGAAVALARAGRRPPALWARLEAALASLRPGWLALAVSAVAFLLYLLLLPAHRRYGPVAGDEPKYLRMALSLCRDLDADMSPAPIEEASWARRIEGAQRLVQATAGALASLARGDSPPPRHRWVFGDFQDWMLHGWKGGYWYMQPLGLPALLVPAACLEERIGDRFAPGSFTFATLGLLWALGLAQTSRLAAEVSGSTLAGLVAGAATAASAPLLVSAWHVYPETAAAAAVPWLLRHVRAGGPELGPARVLALGLVAGGLPWLHLKFLLLALTLATLLFLRLVPRSRALLLAAGAFALPLVALLLFEYHVTGLLRPDGRYIRHRDDVYRGPEQFLSPGLVAGAANATVGARGFLVIAPVLVGGVLALPLLWRRRRRETIGLVCVLLSLLAVLAMYGGHSPGPPSRIMGPVACVLAAGLAVGLAERRLWLPFRWTVAALALVTLAVAAPMARDWRRINNPWRGVPEAADVSRALPGSAYTQGSAVAWLPPLVFGVVLGLGARAVARSPAASGEDPEAKERDVLRVHLAWWASILAASVGLAAVDP